MADDQSTKAKAWVLFDEIVAQGIASAGAVNPWVQDAAGEVYFDPDLHTLSRLLGVPLQLRAGTQSGVPALALDVWLSYELRRAGFAQDHVWPRPSHPRILPMSIVQLLDSLPQREQKVLRERLASRTAIRGVTGASASILGKNYLKQVDVIVTDWMTGPEVLISTKRMDSSYGKNAANRVEESYGDAKNLRLRHPLAALGFVIGLRSDILTKEPETAEWLLDLVGKLGREDDAYHATCVVFFEYADQVAPPADTGTEEDIEDPLAGAGVIVDPTDPAPEPPPPEQKIAEQLARLPRVMIVTEETPDHLAPGTFLASIVNRVLETTPVTMHREARKRRRSPRI